MSKMFIANCTLQVQDFQYRLPESQKLHKIPIEIGAQIPLPGDLSTPEIDYIIEQHARYGMVNASEVDRTKPFIGVCYSLDKPVPLVRMQSALEHNQDVLGEMGQRLREEAALAAEKITQEEANRVQATLTAMEMSVRELEHPDRENTSVNDTIRVDRRAAQAREGGRGKAAAAAKRGRR